MVKLPPPKNQIASAIYAHYERTAKDWRRDHLGASLIGDENCLRHLWYSFRWAQAPEFEGRILRLFETGQREEERVVANLKALDWRVEDVDPATDEQWRVAFVGGHVGGGSDGAVLGVIGAPKTWHLLEVKTMNERRFKVLQKEKVRKAQPGHYAQMQIYMKGLGLKRALYIVVCKDNDWIYVERVAFDSAYAEAMVAKAEMVVRAPEPLSKISEDPTWFECKFCNHRPICHLQQVEKLERNCRTCTSSTPMEDGTWRCEFHKAIPLPETQRVGCEDHLFVPSLLPWDAVDACEDERYVVYQKPDGSKLIDKEMKLCPST